MSLAATLGFTRIGADDDVVILRAAVGAEHTNMHGTGHGGFVYALADEAFALASNAGDADAVAVSVHMDYFRAVRPGDLLEARAVAENVGRRLATYRVELRATPPGWSGEPDDAGGAPVDAPTGALGGPLVALFTGTVYRRERVAASDASRPSS